MIKKLNYITASIIILSNLILFLPGTFELIRTGGGSWGFGLLLLPITIVGNIYLIPACLTFVQKYRENLAILIINITGVLGSLFWIIFFLTSPK